MLSPPPIDDNMKKAGKRIKREKRAVGLMIQLYCRHNHPGHEGICAECAELLAYAHKRLDGCKYGEDKTTCGKCRTHCYRPEMRMKICKVMRYSGPRMLFRHPLIALGHIFAGLRKPRDPSHSS
ncbi:hypothetical protein DP2500 [Desulfotalea psychrophila LSv54]|uniref:Nitrous oxide-stimulated promoter family protein n=2 Tax=Desulfotalea psychrophila TaxID=84980 RepID=Q6AK97_DESPS|nr:hypothetical protein DP2500 [Desulfotalea psychrophila LSv54]